MLGWTETTVTVVDLDSVVHVEFAENVHRKNFTLSELAAISAEVERIEREGVDGCKRLNSYIARRTATSTSAEIPPPAA